MAAAERFFPPPCLNECTGNADRPAAVGEQVIRFCHLIDPTESWVLRIKAKNSFLASQSRM